MAIIESTYHPSILFQNPHVNTIFPTLFRRPSFRYHFRERIDTNDGDFLDIDWVKQGSGRVVILSHGLEGSSERCYVKGMANALFAEGYDICAWNYRSCSGEINRTYRLYHSGSTDDLNRIVAHVSNSYKDVYLVGFSMGGNLSLKYLGEQSGTTVKKCVAFSVPCDLKGSSATLAQWQNKIYMNRFLRKLKEKVVLKEAQFPDLISSKSYSEITSFKLFDDRYTSKIHGFKDAEDYWDTCSSKRFIPSIKTPTLLINAKDDPFLSESCFPVDECKNHSFVTLELPQYGGHIGFVSKGKNYWSENRVIEFFNNPL